MTVLVKSSKLFYVSPSRVNKTDTCRKRVRGMHELRDITLPHAQRPRAMRAIATVHMLVTLVATACMCAASLGCTLPSAAMHWPPASMEPAAAIAITAAAATAHNETACRTETHEMCNCEPLHVLQQARLLEPWDFYDALLDGSLFVVQAPVPRAKPRHSEFTDQPRELVQSRPQPAEPWDMFDALLSGAVRSAWIH